MTLLSVLTQYSQAQSQLEVLMQAEKTTSADLTFLVRQTNELRDLIVDHEPADQAEAIEKLACLINLIQRETRMLGLGPDLARVLDRSAETCDALSQGDFDLFALEEVPERPVVPAAGTSQNFGGSVADYVAFAEGRVSLIDANYTFIATSDENAAFYGRNQISIMGTHIADLIGEHRFQVRVKPRLDACFEGASQTYHHALNHNGEAFIMRCDMRPIRSGGGPVSAVLVYLTDVTETVRKLRPSADVMANQVLHQRG